MSVWDELRSRGQRLLDVQEQRRRRDVERSRAAAAGRQEAVAREATQAVRKMLGKDIADALGPWRGTAPAFAAIGEPEDPDSNDLLPGDAYGQHGELKYYPRQDQQGRGDIWYRPPLTDASARVLDRDHFARMLANHSIYGDIR